MILGWVCLIVIIGAPLLGFTLSGHNGVESLRPRSSDRADGVEE